MFLKTPLVNLAHALSNAIAIVYIRDMFLERAHTCAAYVSLGSSTALMSLTLSYSGRPHRVFPNWPRDLRVACPLGSKLLMC